METEPKISKKSEISENPEKAKEPSQVTLKVKQIAHHQDESSAQPPN